MAFGQRISACGAQETDVHFSMICVWSGSAVRPLALQWRSIRLVNYQNTRCFGTGAVYAFCFRLQISVINQKREDNGEIVYAPGFNSLIELRGQTFRSMQIGLFKYASVLLHLVLFCSILI